MLPGDAALLQLLGIWADLIIVEHVASCNFAHQDAAQPFLVGLGILIRLRNGLRKVGAPTVQCARRGASEADDEVAGTRENGLGGFRAGAVEQQPLIAVAAQALTLAHTRGLAGEHGPLQEVGLLAAGVGDLMPAEVIALPILQVLATGGLDQLVAQRHLVLPGLLPVPGPDLLVRPLDELIQLHELVHVRDVVLLHPGGLVAGPGPKSREGDAAFIVAKA
mmetsp:Transcript_77210/g.184863  ORF Transcript_77210/g.184863 Transcript_77210/m.184863 type:complete len:221 (-) Transcript_77210:542-1204(-)